MTTFVLTCPRNGKPLTGEIATDWQSLRAGWDTTLKLACEHCGGAHQIAFRDAYVSATLADPSGRFASRLGAARLRSV